MKQGAKTPLKSSFGSLAREYSLNGYKIVAWAADADNACKKERRKENGWRETVERYRAGLMEKWGSMSVDEVETILEDSA